MRKIEKQRFEFLLLINGNIICQRYFGIRNFNEESTDSLEICELVDRIAGSNDTYLGIIPKFLQDKTRDYLWGYYRPHTPQKVEDINRRNISDKKDVFGFKIKVDGEVVGETIFDGNVFPPKVRYQVNIKEIIPDIISEIRDTLSQRYYTETYGDITLKYDFAPYHFEL